MFLEFKKIIKSQHARGWSLQKENENFYLSKFDNGINDDEYRIYIKDTGDSVDIVHVEKLKHNYRSSVSKIMPVNMNHEIVLQAKKLIDLHPSNANLIHN